VGQFARALDHLNRIFKPYASKGREVRSVAQYPDALFLTADVLGTQKYQDAQQIQQITAGETSATEFTIVPTDEVWFVLAHSVHHTDPAGNHWIHPRLRYSSGTLNTSTYLAPSIDVDNLIPNAVPRAYYAPPRSRLGGESADNIPVGSALVFRAIIVSLPLGEYTRS